MQIYYPWFHWLIGVELAILHADENVMRRNWAKARFMFTCCYCLQLSLSQCLFWIIGDKELTKLKIIEPAVAAFVAHILVVSTCQSWIGCFDWYMPTECFLVCIGFVYFMPWGCPRPIPNKYCSATTVWPIQTNTVRTLLSDLLFHYLQILSHN